MNFAIIGATGNVGRKTIEVLEKSNIQINNLYLVASKKSAGKTLTFKKKEIKVEQLENFDFSKAEITIFAAGSEIAKNWIPSVSKKTIVIDNSKFFRMHEGIPLVVPEVNPEALKSHNNIISNPNCSTIQMLMALAPLKNKYGITRIVVSTYQSITGTGVKAVQQLENEYNNVKGPMAYPYPIHRNALPHCDDFMNNGYTKEEMKLLNETHKIFGDESIGVTATAIRIPVVGGHSESVNVQLKREFELNDVRKLLYESPGIIVQDNPETNSYPMPIYSEGKDEVFVGRVRSCLLYTSDAADEL